MNSGPHRNRSQIEALMRQTMNPTEILAALQHVQRCEECRREAESIAPLTSIALIAGEPAPHLDPETLHAYITGIIDAADREIAEAHFEECRECREDLADVRRNVEPRGWWLAAAAAVGIAIIAAALLMFRRVETAAPPATMPRATTAPAAKGVSYSDPSWSALVANAVASGSLPRRNDQSDFHESPETLRGPADRIPMRLSPAGVVVDSTRPRFQWTAVRNARYAVLLQAFGADTVRRSPPLRRNEWSPGFDLRRGTTYQWEVRVEGAGAPLTVPAPPAPLALFRVLELSLHDELARAHEAYPGDPLLLCVLDARAGLDEEARAEIERLQRDPARRALAQQFLHSLQTGR